MPTFDRKTGTTPYVIYAMASGAFTDSEGNAVVAGDIVWYSYGGMTLSIDNATNFEYLNSATEMVQALRDVRWNIEQSTINILDAHGRHIEPEEYNSGCLWQ